LTGGSTTFLGVSTVTPKGSLEGTLSSVSVRGLPFFLEAKAAAAPSAKFLERDFAAGGIILFLFQSQQELIFHFHFHLHLHHQIN